jgi:hypothetical protein
MKGGEHATASRARIAEHAPFILAQAARGVPLSAIAQMIGRSRVDVATVISVGSLSAVARPTKLPEPAVKNAPANRARKVRRRWRRSLTPRVRKAIEAVADYYGVTVDELIGRRGATALQPIRQEAYHAVYDLRMPDGSRRYSSICVGQFFGGRDHATILSGVAAHMARLAEVERVAA